MLTCTILFVDSRHSTVGIVFCDVHTCKADMWLHVMIYTWTLLFGLNTLLTCVHVDRGHAHVDFARYACVRLDVMLMAGGYCWVHKLVKVDKLDVTCMYYSRLAVLTCMYISVDAMVEHNLEKVDKLTCRRNTSIDVDEGWRSDHMHVLNRYPWLAMLACTYL